MKLNTKNFLPMILMFVLLILLAGCFGVPSDESPGYTPGTISGIIAAPCCSTSAEPVSEPCCVSPEYWCYYCEKTWSLQDSIEVVLTYGEDEIATTITNEDGEFTFTNVAPGKNYVITAYCPDFDDDRPLVKDVALEVIESESFDTKITDCVSTSLGLVVDFLVYYTEWGPEDISLDEVIADKPDFPNFPKFKALVYEVCRVLGSCENVNTDEDVQDALCQAAEEISGLDIGCGAGWTPSEGEGEGEDECDGNVAPNIGSVLFDGTAVSIGETIPAVIGTSYVITVNAADADGILGSLSYSASINGVNTASTFSNEITVTPDTAGNFAVYLYVNDGCDTTTWGPVTVEVDCCSLDPVLDIDISVQIKRSSALTLCLDDCAIINSVTVNYTDGTDPKVITDLNDEDLYWNWDASKVSFNQSTGVICLVGGLAGTPGTYTISVIYTDPCGTEASASVDITFEDCSSCPLLNQSLLIVVDDATPCSDDCATIDSIKVRYTDGTSDLVITPPYSGKGLTWSVDSGISFNETTGKVCLTSGVLGTDYDVDFTYTDPCEETATGTATVNFIDCSPCADNQPPSISIANKTIAAGSSLSYKPGDAGYSASDDNTNGSPTYAISNEPTGMTIDPNTGEIAWNTDCGDSGTYYNIRVTITDACDQTDYDDFNLTVTPCVTCDECSKNWSDDCYGVKSYSEYDPSTNTTTFTYTFWEKDDKCDPDPCKDISHVELNFGSQSWDVDMWIDQGTGSWTEEVRYGLIKMDDLADGFIKGTIQITFDGCVESAPCCWGILYIKAGTTWKYVWVCKPNL